MVYYLGPWVIPVNPAKCLAANQSVICNFALYNNATTLTDAQKLVPNDDITGATAGAIIAVILSFLLFLDKLKVHWYNQRRGREAVKEYTFYLKAVNTVENIMHVNSDQQLVTSVALLFAINHQACEITAYHYNLACTMLLMGIITHLNTLISIPDFLYKGKAVAAYRCFGIACQTVISGIVFSARHSKTWPAKAQSLAILPAACFENMNATDGLGFSDFVTFAQNVTAGSTANTTANTTQILNNINVITSAEAGMGEYATLVTFMFLALLVLLFDYAENKLGKKDKKHVLIHPISLRWSTIIFSAISILASSIIIGISYKRYNSLRDGMEIPAWYDAGSEDAWTYSQILPILLMGSGSIAALKAMTEAFGGIKTQRFEDHMEKVLNGAEKAYSDAGSVEYNGSPLVPQTA
ncbi:hypothetical protein G7Y89_g8651 [Cudoniella acicularis]|uniref:Uncharacterized protein n=1 Tax=Cudoniella acicularis TaxID=354080 RepID=A0A8H4W0V7_9HELO|nr:hypothetical protein G7Y89_g8651 [Cudoniella acicularis]